MPSVDLAPVVINEIQIIGSRCGPFEPALASLEQATVDVLPLVSKRFSLERSDDALEAAATSGAGKMLIECG